MISTKLNNYNVLFSMKFLKTILEKFIESFMVLYFLQLSDSSILPYGIYKLVSVTATFLTIFSLRNLCKTKHRKTLLQIGILLDLVFFLLIILLKEDLVNHIILVGVIYGLEEGFYYSVYNMFESEGVSNKNRNKFLGTFTAISSLLTSLFPVIFGFLIYYFGFISALIMVIIIVIIRIILSFKFNDNYVSNNKKVEIKKYIDSVKDNELIRKLYLIDFCNGFTYSQGAFLSIVTIYIIKIFSNSISLGIFTALFSVIAAFIGYMFANKINKKHYTLLIIVSMFLTIVSLCTMLLYCNIVTVVMFNLFQTISREITNLINGSSKSNISNFKYIKDNNYIEFWIVDEFVLFIARVISQLIFILLAFTNSMYIILIYIAFLVILTKASIQLQHELRK